MPKSNQTASKFKIAFGHHSTDPVVSNEDYTFKELTEVIEETTIENNGGDKNENYFVRGYCKKLKEYTTGKGKLIKNKNIRCNKAMDSASMLVLDVDESSNDKKLLSPRTVHKKLVKLNLNHVIHTSFSHGVNGKIKYRILIPCALPCIPEWIEPSNNTIIDLISGNLKLDNVSNTLAQRFYYASTANPDKFKLYQYHDGQDFEPVSEYKTKSGEVVKKRDRKTSRKNDRKTVGVDGHFYDQLKKEGQRQANYYKSRILKDTNDTEEVYEDIEDKLRGMCNHNNCDLNDYEHKENVLQSIRGAIQKVISEGEQPKAIPINESKLERPIPKFPDNPMKGWPMPWGLIWEEYQKIPRTCVPSLLFPTVISIHAYLLNSVYMTKNDRRPNMAFLGIAPSTANKDVNSKDVSLSINEALKRKGFKYISTFNDSSNISKLTGDSAFLKEFSSGGNLFWLDTEATPLFQMLAQSGANNAHVKALEYKITEIVDGKRISGKSKAKSGESINGISDPNCQVLLYAQPSTISKYLSDGIIDSGVFGRMIVSIHEEDSNPFEDVFITEEKEQYEIPDDLIKLYENSPDKNKSEKVHVGFNKESISKMDKWAKTFLKKKAGSNEQAITVLRRMGITAEQLYSVVVGVSHLWNKIDDAEAKIEHFDASLLFPVLEYWTECKIYGVNELVNTSIDPGKEVTVQAMKELIGGKKQGNSKQIKTVKKYHAVTEKMIVARIKRNSKLKEKVSDKCKRKDLSDVVSGAIRSMSFQHEIAEIEVPNTSVKYYGFIE